MLLSYKKTTNENQLKKNEMIFLLLLSIIMILPFYEQFVENTLIYLLKYVLLFIFLTIVFIKYYRYIDKVKLLIFAIFLFIISSFNSVYVSNNLDFETLLKSTGFTLMYLLVAVSAIFLFKYIPFNKFKSMLLIFLAALLITVIIPNLIFTNSSLGYYTVGDRIRFNGIFNNPNEMSRFSMLTFFIVLRLWPLVSGKSVKLIFLFAGISSLYLIYLSDSRASMVICMLSLIIIFSVKLYKMLPQKIFFSITILIVIIGLIVLFFYINENTITFDYNKMFESLSGRLEIWQKVFDVSLFGFFFGEGATQTVGIHNGYIEVFKYFGLFGFIVWMLILFFLIARKIKFTFRNATSSNLIGLGIIFLFLIYHMVEGALFSFGNLANLYLWLEISQLNDLDL